MALTDEQIKNIMVKDLLSKTILVNPEDLDVTISNHINDGWKIVKQSNIGDRIKITFTKNK